MNHFTYAIVYPAIFPYITSRAYGPEIGDMDKGIIKGCEDTCYTEHQLAERDVSFEYIHGRWMFHTISDLGTEGDVLLRGTGGFLWRHGALFIVYASTGS
jgi:hypothetical protein